MLIYLKGEKMTQDEILKYNIEHIKSSIPGIEKSAGATKDQLANFMNTSRSSIDRAIASGGYGIPNYIKGEGRNSRIIFPLINIALFLTNNTIKTA